MDGCAGRGVVFGWLLDGCWSCVAEIGGEEERPEGIGLRERTSAQLNTTGKSLHLTHEREYVLERMY
jgi:hypothetical protein